MSDELPEGWAQASLSECVDVLDSQRVPVNSDERAQRKGPIPYYGATGQVGWIDDYLFNEELLLLGEDGAPFLDKSKPIAYIIAGKSWVNNHAHVLCACSQITNNRYLKFYLDNFDFHGYVNGTTRMKLTQASLNSIPVRLAPMLEQRRIAEKLEKLLAEVEQCKGRMVKIPVLLKRFRQSVLAAACSGRLTADWRETHNPVTDIDSTLESTFTHRTSAAKTARERQSLIELFEQTEEEDSDTLPEGWKYVYLNKICDSFDYGTSSKSLPTGAVPVLRMGNIQGGKIDWNDLIYTSDAEEIQKYSLNGKTVLFNRTNSPELVGKTAIYRGEHPAIFAGYLIRINPLPELDPEYLNLCLNTNYARQFCQQVKTDGVSQSNINAQKLGHFEIPLCSTEEQQEIVERTRKFLVLADRIEERYQGAKKQVDSLAQSILAKAFRGELVPTEAELAAREGRDYESAPQLLERIRAANTETVAVRGNGHRRAKRRTR